MIPRYTRPAMGRIWSDQNRFQQWLEVELAATEALAEVGVVPADAAKLLRQHAGFDVERIHEIEEQVKHDVIAFTTAVAETMAFRFSVTSRYASSRDRGSTSGVYAAKIARI